MFEQELNTYNAWLPELIENNEGNYVVIKGDLIAGIRPSFETALTLGYETFGLDGFMVKQILLVEPTHFLSPIQRLEHAV
jgi:hypothetical protein